MKAVGGSGFLIQVNEWRASIIIIVSDFSEFRLERTRKF